jgi:hypothetical protein
MDIFLEGTRRKSEHVRADAESITRYVRRVAGLPEYGTAAEEAIENAELALTEALLAVKLAKTELKSNRVTEGVSK